MERPLRAIRERVEDAGGLLHPGLEMRCEAGELAVACTVPYAPRTVLTTIPETCTLPVDTVGLRVAGGRACHRPGRRRAQRRPAPPVRRHAGDLCAGGEDTGHRSASVWCGLGPRSLDTLKDVVAGRCRQPLRADLPGIRRVAGDDRNPAAAELPQVPGVLCRAGGAAVSRAGSGQRLHRPPSLCAGVPQDRGLGLRPNAPSLPGVSRRRATSASSPTRIWTPTTRCCSTTISTRSRRWCARCRCRPEVSDAGTLQVGARMAPASTAHSRRNMPTCAPTCRGLLAPKTASSSVICSSRSGFRPRALHQVLRMLLASMPGARAGPRWNAASGRPRRRSSISTCRSIASWSGASLRAAPAWRCRRRWTLPLTWPGCRSASSAPTTSADRQVRKRTERRPGGRRSDPCRGVRRYGLTITEASSVVFISTTR